jgi:uncharacterized protein (DUF362 family)/NAD-dependent dihydropyrimidine dehydrogenase PreA subunit
VYQAVVKGFELIGARRLFRPGEQIVLKPNILNGSDPVRCVVTHPAVFGAAARALGAMGLALSYGDSPCVEKFHDAAHKAGFAAVAAALGIAAADFDSGTQAVFPGAKKNGRFPIANGVRDADGLVSICKFKTHNFTRMTGAIKNQYGCMPGLAKAQFHTRFPLPRDFAAFIADINAFVAPRLYIMDAVIAMEGDGPNNGDPAPLNVLLFSTDPVALDATACRMVNMNPAFVPTCEAGRLAGLGTWDDTEIDCVGETLDSCRAPGFRIMRTPPRAVYAHGFRRSFQRLVTPRPMIHRARCTRCGRCIRICPVDPKALRWSARKNAAPVHHMERCISCFCCQEACPSRAVSIKRPWVGRLLFAFTLAAFPAGRMIIHAVRRARGLNRGGHNYA